MIRSWIWQKSCFIDQKIDGIVDVSAIKETLLNLPLIMVYDLGLATGNKVHNDKYKDMYTI